MDINERFDLIDKLLHFVFALCVAYQMIMSLVGPVLKMHLAKNSWVFTILPAHKWVGITCLIAIILYLLKALLYKQGIKIRHLFPYGRSDRPLVKEDIATLLKFKIPNRDFGGLAGMVQGLGVLLVLLVALLGFTWYMIFLYTGKGNGQIISIVGETHAVLTNFIWVYLAGHIGMYVLHKLTINKTAMS